MGNKKIQNKPYYMKSEIKTEIKSEIKPEIKSEIKPEIKSEIKPEIKSDIKSEIKSEIKPEKFGPTIIKKFTIGFDKNKNIVLCIDNVFHFLTQVQFSALLDKMIIIESEFLNKK